MMATLFMIVGWLFAWVTLKGAWKLGARAEVIWPALMLMAFPSLLAGVALGAGRADLTFGLGDLWMGAVWIPLTLGCFIVSMLGVRMAYDLEERFRFTRQRQRAA